jgi:hypothetical protein
VVISPEGRIDLLVFQQALDCGWETTDGAKPCGAGDTQLYSLMEVGDFE